jgi:cystathionine beta-lyase
MLCNPHNPTGRVFERSELEAIAEVAVTRQLIVVADEVHADLAYAGHEHVPFASLGPEVARRTITITSATKAYNIPGLRCGLMHFGSSELREKFRSRLPDRALGKVNRFGIEATVVAWRECAGWLESVMTTLRRNRELLAATLSRDLPSVRCYSPEAGYLAWLDCRALDLPGSPFESFLERARFGPSGVGHVRLNFATSESILTDVLARMARSLRM